MGSYCATQGVSNIVSTFPLSFRSDGEDEDNISTKAVVGEVVHDVEGEELESRDVLGPLPHFRWPVPTIQRSLCFSC